MRFQPVPAVFFASSLVLGFTGCTLQNTATPSLSQGLSIQGAVHGGQQPVVGSHVYLMQASNAAYGSSSISLLTAGSGSDSRGTYVKTDTFGGFSVSGDYTCVANTQVYILAIGGNPGLAPGTNNAALALMANLGNCPASGSLATQVPFLSMNEVTTVASVYSIAGYMTDTFAVASSPSPLAATGLSNAFATTGNLIDIAHGKALASTPLGFGTNPQTTLDTLANVLAACVNTDGSVTAGSSGPTPVPASACYTLFNNAKNGTTSPTDTVGAILNIAHNPSANVTKLFNLSAAAAPFQPSLAAAPNDFTLQISFTGGGIQGTITDNIHAHNIAADATGNIWTSNFSTASLSELSPLGVPVSGTSGFTGNGLNLPVGVTVDATGKIWVPNSGGNSVSVFNSAGTAFTGSPFPTGAGTSDVAIDPAGNAWIANRDASSLTKLTNAGAAQGSSIINTNGLQNPVSVAISSVGDVWLAEQGNGDASGFNNAGGTLTNSPFLLVSSVPSPTGNAIDAAGNVWFTDQALSRVFKLDKVGNGVSNPFSNNAFNSPHSIVIDGAGAAWVADLGSNAIIALANNGTSLSGFNGYQVPGSGVPDSIAVDGSGNVWYTTKSDNTLRQIIGAASPVVTPIAAGTANNTLGTRP